MTAALLSVQDIADRLGVSKDYAYRLVERGDIARTQVGRLVRVTEESLADFIAERTKPARKSRKGAAA